MKKVNDSKQMIVLTDIIADPTKATNPPDLGNLANSAIRSGKPRRVQLKVEKIDEEPGTVTFSIPAGELGRIGIAVPKSGLNIYPTEDLIRHVKNLKENKSYAKKHKNRG